MDFVTSKYQDENYKLIYSPRTTFDSLKTKENTIYIQLVQSFDIKTLTILRRHFKEHIGSITKDLFICILQKHISLTNFEFKNKKKLIIKLLSKLFDEIDADTKEIITWNEFVNFLANYKEGKKEKMYYLKKYYQSKMDLNPIEKININKNQDFSFNINKNNKINFCFYIEKFRFLGLTKEGDTKINFFNTETNKPLNLEIDFSLIQKEIDKHVLYQLDEKIDNLLERKEEDYMHNKKILKEKKIQLMIKRNKRYKSNLSNKNNNSFDRRNAEIEKEKNILNKSENINKIIPTQKKIEKRKIISYKGIASGLNKKYYSIATTLFLNEYNLLLISTTNNIISAWKYKEKEEYFENVNLINHNIENEFNKKKCIFEKDEVLIPLLMTEYTQYSMCFDNLTNCLYTGQTDGKIMKWDITLNKPILILDINNFNEKNDFVLPLLEASNNSYQKETKDILLKRGQSDFNKILKSLPEQRRNMISCLILIDPLKILCSAHYNGLIVLWDLIYYKPKRIYVDQKTGIYQVLYNYNMNHIYTCGFEHDIFIYDPYIDKEAIYKLRGHKSSINSIALIPENNELISIDISGIIKIWDITNFFNFQTININDAALLKANNIDERDEIYNKLYKKKISANIHIQTFPDLSKFLIYGKKFLLFEKGNSDNPDLCDDYKIIGCFYNPKTYNIVTISHKKVQFWNILNGKLVKIFRDLMSVQNINSDDTDHHFENQNSSNITYDITSFAHDINYKKLYLGDSIGRIKSFYLETGVLSNQFDSHKEEITHIIFSFKYNYLISCSKDLIIKIHENKKKLNEANKALREYELINEKIKTRFESRISKILLRKMILNEERGVLITCLSNGYIKELDIEHFKMINEMDCLNIQFDNLKNLTLITTAEYLKDINMLFINLDNFGKKFIALKNNKYFNLLIGKDIFIKEEKININRKDSDYNNKKYVIVCCYYDINTRRLFLGDSFGDLICYNLEALYNGFLNEKNLDKNESEKIAKIGVNCDILFKIKINAEPINFIFKPEQLKPEILIILSIEKTAKLIDINTGKIIDSLKQISINENPFPIAVKYSINTPYYKKTKPYLDLNDDFQVEEDSNTKSLTIQYERDNRIERQIKTQKKYPYIIYRKNINKFDLNPIDSKKKLGNNKKEDLIEQSYLVLINSVKEKLKLTKFSKEIPEDKSTLWKYDINLNKLKEKEEENIVKIDEKIKTKEEEINITENNFEHFQIHDKNYIPNYINDLSQDKIDKMKYLINKKIRDVNLSFRKKVEIKTEIKKIEKIKEKVNLSINDILKSSPNKKDINIFLTPIRPLRKNLDFKTNIQTKEKNKLEKIKEIPLKNEKNIIFENNNTNNNKKTNKRIKMVYSSRRYNYNYKNEIFDIPNISKEDKFKEFKIQFDEKINEIKRPIEFFKLRKKIYNS